MKHVANSSMNQQTEACMLKNRSTTKWCNHQRHKANNKWIPSHVLRGATQEWKCRSGMTHNCVPVNHVIMWPIHLCQLPANSTAFKTTTKQGVNVVSGMNDKNWNIKIYSNASLPYITMTVLKLKEKKVIILYQNHQGSHRILTWNEYMSL